MLCRVGQATRAIPISDLAWSGAALGNNATAMAQITFAMDYLEALGSGYSYVDLVSSTLVDSFSITVSGASFPGDGTFTLADYQANGGG